MFKRISCLLIAAVIMVSMLTPANVMAKAKETVYKVPKVKSEEHGIWNIQRAGGKECAFYCWDTSEENEDSDIMHRLYTFSMQGKKIKRKKTVVGKNYKGKQQKVLRKHHFSYADGCMDSRGKYLYMSEPHYGTKVILYRFSLTKDKVKKINLSKQVGKLVKNPDTSNSVKCYSIAKNRIGLRIEKHKKNKYEPVGYRVCILNTKTNKIVKKYDCNFKVEGMNEKYIYGFEMSKAGRLCYRRQKKGAKVTRVHIENPEVKVSYPEEEAEYWKTYYDMSPASREHCTRVVCRGNKLYYITLNGVFSYNVKTKKNAYILKTSESKYLKKYIPDFVHAMTVSKKGELFLMCAPYWWRSGYEVIKIKAK